MDWLRKAIVRAGGPKAVATAAGMSRAHLKNLYRGVRPLTVEAVNRLEPLLDVPEETWFEALRSRPMRKRHTDTTEAA